jgi:hypothetical protein
VTSGTGRVYRREDRSFAKRVRLTTLDFGYPLVRNRRLLHSTRGDSVSTVESPKIVMPASIRYRDGTEEKLRAAVPKRIKQLVADYFGFALMPFHNDVLTYMFEGGYLDVQLPTEHGKSTICDVVYPVLMWMHDPDAAIILCCTNLDDGKSWLARIKDKLESAAVDPRSAALLRDYPWLERPYGGNRRWGATEITIAGRTDLNNRNPSIYAIGQGADGIRQRRGRFIGDDLEGKGAVRDKPREALWDWMKKEAMRTIEDVADVPRRLFCNVGTPFDPDSVHIRLEELKYANGTPIFTVYKQPYRYEGGRLIWPRKRQKIEEMRALWDEETWAIAMELNPKGTNPFSLTVREVTEKTSAAGAPMPVTDWTFVSLDPASGSRKSRADYAGIAVERIRWEEDWILPRVEVVECYRYSEEAVAQVTFGLELAEKHKAPLIVETNAMQRVYKGLFAHFARQLRASGTLSWFDERQHILTHYTTKANKTDNKMGVTVVKTLARSGNLHILESESSKVLQREIANLGTGSDDHITMAVWFPIRYVYDHRRRRARPVLQAVSRLPFSWTPAIGPPRVLRVRSPFQNRRFLSGSQPGEERFDRPMLRDTNEG